MTFVGDLERLFATSLYPLRVPIFIGLAVVATVVVVLAVRGRWDRTAARHRRATGAIVVLLVVVGLPVAWYLGSPLFISTRLEEAPPVVAAGPSTAAAPGVSAAPGSTAGPGAIAGQSRTGTFRGADDFHFGRGTAALIVGADGAAVLRFEDFAVRNGPDLYVYLSPDAAGYAEGAIEIGKLKADQGAFNYEIPPATDPAAARSVVIWCKQFAVQFAVAPLE